jgi:ATP-dependent RNA helicase HelY
MTINLVHQMGPDQAHELLERSFAQYQADRSVAGLVRAISRNEQLMQQVAAELSDDGGEEQTAEALISYARLRAKLSERERAQARSSRLHRRQLANEALSSLRRGDIISITRGKRGGLAVVLEADRDSTDPRPLVLTENRWAGRISSADYSDSAAPLGSMTLPKRVEHRQPRVRRDMASALRSAAAGLTVQSRKGGRRNEPDAEPELRALRDELRHHPAHPIADREAKVRIAERYLRLEREIDQLRGKVAAATNSLARTFDRIVGLLTERRFIEERSQGALHVTDDGRLLARIYSESDLLVAECLRGGLWRNLGPAELASVVSAVVYETRGSDGPAPRAAEIPTAPLRRALAETRRLSAVLRADEHRHRLNLSREPDEGFVTAVYRWATTGDLAAALEASDVTGTGTPLPAGDFVRWCRQVVDMLDQIRNAATDSGLRNSAKRAIDDIRRGVVAVDGG